jgi:hypothetical protein
MITDVSKAEEENIQGREEEAKDIELGATFRWESVHITPEQMRKQI